MSTDDASDRIEVTARPAGNAAWKGNLASRLLDALQFLNPSTLAREPDLVRSRWPAYYNFDPMRANLEFAKAFQSAFRKQFTIDVDRRQAASVQGVNILRVLQPQDGRLRGDLTAINDARQVADSYGLPYEPFIKFCMQFASDRGVRHIARPNQLVPAKFRQAWERELETWQTDFYEGMPSRYRSERQAERSGRPGCFGVPGSTNASPVCADCKFFQGCSQLSQAVISKAEEKKRQLGKPVSYIDKEEATRLQRNEKKKLRQRAVRAGTYKPPRRKKTESAQMEQSQ